MGLVSQVFFFFFFGGGEWRGEVDECTFSSLPLFVTDNGRLPKKSRKRGLINSLFHLFIRPHAREKRRERERRQKWTFLSFFRICDHVCSVMPHLKSSFASTDLFSPLGFCICVRTHFTSVCEKKKPFFPFRAVTHTTIFFLHNNNTWQQHCPFSGQPKPEKTQKSDSSPSYYLSSPAREEKPFP